MILNSVLREKNGEERLVTFCPFPVYSHTGHRPAFAATSLNLARSQVFPSIKAGGGNARYFLGSHLDQLSWSSV